MLNKLYINKNNIINNLKKVKSLSEIICVVKDDAYGLGIKNIFPILYEQGERYFAVAFFEEAEEIREIRDDVDIMVLNYTEEENLEYVIKNNIETAVFNMEQLKSYINVLKEKSGQLKIHLKFNTGMNRLGFDLEEIELLSEIINKNNLQIKSMFSHISNSENEEYTKKQLEKFREIIKKTELYGIKHEFTHISASPALFKYSGEYNFDYSRVGMALYGLEPLSSDVGLDKCITLESKIINIRKVPKGEYISYGEKNRLKEDTVVGIIPMGYAQGIQMQIENTEAYVLVNGEKADIIGEVCMDMMMINITSIENVKNLDEVVIIGKQGEKEISLRDISAWTSTIQDDIITKISKKINRVVI